MLHGHNQCITDEALRAALCGDELSLHYQPIRATDDLELVAYEALLRWRHPVHGSVPPIAFIPLAERSALIHDIGLWVVQRACRDCGTLDGRYIGVNVSAVQLTRPEFAETFARVCKDENVLPASLTVEITESVALSDGVERNNLEALRALGCYVAIDDFGTGHASLDYIDRFPFNVLKIDKSFVAGLGRSPCADAYVGSVCELARQRHIVTVAEGVETAEQLALLRQLGCSRVQGYLFGRPAAVDAWRSTVAPSFAACV